MNFLFWNIRKNQQTYLILKEILKTYEIDICLLAECPEISQEEVNMIMGEQYQIHTEIAPGKIKYIHNRGIRIVPLKDMNRASSKIVYTSQCGPINIIGCHLKDKYNYDEVSQRTFAGDFCEFIKDVEDKTQNYRTIVIGDFNMNPFEEAMTSVTFLNSVMDKAIARKKVRIFNKKKYHYFYNPMWRFWGYSENIPCGTFYFTHSQKPMLLYWNLFDQVLIRPELLSSFCDDSLKIITHTENFNLLKRNGIINTDISDHLPIVFTLNLN